MPFPRKLLVLYVAFCLGLGVVWLRVGQLQFLEGDEWERVARESRRRHEPLQAPRGRIVDARGRVLARDVPVYQLAFVGWDWERRGRVRCSSCGVVGYYRVDGVTQVRPPTTCACVSAARRRAGGALAAARTPAVFEPLPQGDLRPLETALGLPPGDLARRATARVTRVREMVASFRERQLEAGVSEFLVGDQTAVMEADLLLRAYPMETTIPREAAQLVLLDPEGQFRGFRIRTAHRRRYPQGDFAPQLLGFTTAIKHREELQALRREHPDRITLSSSVGRVGLERAYQWVLAGWPGSRVMALGPDRQFTVEVEETPPQRGRTLTLSVDLAASRIAEAALARYGTPDGYFPNPAGQASGAFVMLDAETGRVLVWSEMPRFNLNTDLGTLYDPARVRAEADLQAERWVPLALPDGGDRAAWEAEFVTPAPFAQSRVATTAVEPGSGLKPLIGLAMQHSGRPVLPSFRCGTLRGKPHCHNCGTVTLRGAICQSCNQYMAAALRDFGPFKLYRTSVPAFMDRLGFGHAPSPVMSEWASGLWLRDWIDLTPDALVAGIQARFDGRHEGVPLELVLTRSRHAPARFGTGRTLVTQLLTDAVTQVRRESGRERIGLRISREATEGSQIVVRFEIRALGNPALAHYAVTHDPLHPETWPLALRRAMRRADALGGTVSLDGSLAAGGVVTVTARFDKSIGRRTEDDPPVLRADDARNIAIGQGPVLVTPLQMARAMAAIANGGRLVTPGVVDRIDGQPLRPDPVVDLQWSPAFVDVVRGGMQDVVTMGTARGIFRRVDARVYGKTGTAQVGAAWRPWKRSDDAAWHHWFVGFAERPGERPVAFACVLHARTEAAASQTSALAVADVLEAWFGGRR